jgi:hypothetical protein
VRKPNCITTCYHRRGLLTSDEGRRIFESALERVRRIFRLQVYGYVVMPEHVHLLLSEPQEDTSIWRTAPLKPKDGLNGPPVLSEPQQDTLADALKSLKQGVSRRLRQLRLKGSFDCGPAALCLPMLRSG